MKILRKQTGRKKTDSYYLCILLTLADIKKVLYEIKTITGGTGFSFEDLFASIKNMGTDKHLPDKWRNDIVEWIIQSAIKNNLLWSTEKYLPNENIRFFIDEKLEDKMPGRPKDAARTAKGRYK